MEFSRSASFTDSSSRQLNTLVVDSWNGMLGEHTVLKVELWEVKGHFKIISKPFFPERILGKVTWVESTHSVTKG